MIQFFKRKKDTQHIQDIQINNLARIVTALSRIQGVSSDLLALQMDNDEENIRYMIEVQKKRKGADVK